VVRGNNGGMLRRIVALCVTLPAAAVLLSGCTPPTLVTALSDSHGQLHWALCQQVNFWELEVAEEEDRAPGDVVWSVEGHVRLESGDVVDYGAPPDSGSGTSGVETVRGPDLVDAGSTLWFTYLGNDHSTVVARASIDLATLEPGVWTDNRGRTLDGPCGDPL